ncbi:MAG: hypothetical protein ACI9D0_001798 [Bacteroidia bacterium]|jgi:hypothetical protein
MESPSTKVWREDLLVELVPHVVHRLGNLLTVVLGTADLLAMHEQDQDRLTQLEAVCDGARRSTDLIRALGDHARSKQELPSALDLSHQFSSLFELLDPVAKAGGCTLKPFESAGMTLVKVDAIGLQLLAMGVLIGECRTVGEQRRPTTLVVRAIELGRRVVVMATTTSGDGAPLAQREIAPNALTLAKELNASIKVRQAMDGRARVVMLGFAALS